MIFERYPKQVATQNLLVIKETETEFKLFNFKTKEFRGMFNSHVIRLVRCHACVNH